jgi:hypothetical protein
MAAIQVKTEIINTALLYMNQDSILDPNGEGQNAKLCAQVYEPTLAECLSAHPWSFASRVVRLEARAEKPKDVRFERQYQLPEDLGRIWSVSVPEFWSVPEYEDGWGRREAHYTVQGKMLLSNEAPLQLLYTTMSAEPIDMPPLFRAYFATAIADKLFQKVTGSRDGAAAMHNLMLEAEAEARHADGVGKDSMPPERPDLLLRARRY